MTTAAGPTPRHHHPLSLSLSPPTFAEAWRRQWSWLVAGIALSFLLPFALTDLMPIDRDLYYGLYVGSVFTFVGLWLRFGIDAPRALLMRNWRIGLVLGVAFVGVMVAVVLKDPSTTHPHGLDFAAAIIWRGVIYGLTDGVLLSVFPILAVFSAFAGKHILERRLGKIAIGALALAVSLLFTAVYHLGYSDFRGEKVRKPLLGDVMWSIPTLVTLSPIASPITHAGLHVSAVIHSYKTDTFLPPHSNTSTATQGTTVGETAFVPVSRATVKIFVTRGTVGRTCTRVTPLHRGNAVSHRQAHRLLLQRQPRHLLRVAAARGTGGRSMRTVR